MNNSTYSNTEINIIIASIVEFINRVLRFFWIKFPQILVKS